MFATIQTILSYINYRHFMFFCLISLCIICTLCLMYKAYDHNTTITKALYSISLLFAVMIFSTSILKFKAQDHGLYTTDITIYKMITGIQNSHKEDKLPDDLNDKIIIYYRFGCPDCEAIYNDLNTYTTDNDLNVYYVSTRSNQGKKLLKQFPVKTVPTGIYIYKNSHGELTYIQKDLCNTDTSLNYNALNRLFFLQSNIADMSIS